MNEKENLEEAAKLDHFASTLCRAIEGIGGFACARYSFEDELHEMIVDCAVGGEFINEMQDGDCLRLEINRTHIHFSKVEEYPDEEDVDDKVIKSEIDLGVVSIKDEEEVRGFFRKLGIFLEEDYLERYGSIEESL